MKKFLTILAVAFLAIGSLQAQAKTNSETKIFALEMGSGFVYNIGTKLVKPTQTFSAVFGLSDVVQAGFTIVKSAGTVYDFTGVKIVVYPATDLGVNIMFGADASAPALINSGFGVGYNVFRNVTGPLTSALQVNSSYTFNDIATGNLNFGLNLKIGL